MTTVYERDTMCLVLTVPPNEPRIRPRFARRLIGSRWAAKMAEQDARGALSVARQEGLAEGHKSGLAEGHKSGLAEGEAAGTAKAILTVLAARGLGVDEAIRARILGSSDVVMLARWLAQAVTAASAEDAIAVPRRSDGG